jgi:hypothetical protein
MPVLRLPGCTRDPRAPAAPRDQAVKRDREVATTAVRRRLAVIVYTCNAGYGKIGCAGILPETFPQV